MIAITARHLERAADAHLERMQLHGPRPIDRIIASLGVDAHEFAVLGKTLRELRGGPAEHPAYSGGLVDGFVLGVRAARIAQEDS